MPRTRLLLPVELLTIISSLVRHADLPAFALASKCLNTIATPRLYTHVELVDFLSATACLLTLSSSPAEVYSGRDLPQMVRAITVRASAFEQVYYEDNDQLGQQLADAMVRMVNIEVLRCGEYALCSLGQILGILTQTSFPRLQVVELAIDSPLGTAGSVHHSPSQPEHPSLRALKLFIPTGPSPQSLAYTQSIVSACSKQLESLSLATPHTLSEALLANPEVFPALTRLDVEWSVLHTLRPLASLSRIRALSVHSRFTVRGGRVLPRTAFPALEELACPFHYVTKILWDGTQTDPPRPVHTLALDHASYERNGGAITHPAPYWADVHGALKYVARPWVPIKHLRFCVKRLDVRDMAYWRRLCGMENLESLVIVIQSHPTREQLEALGTAVLAHQPRLHTLLLSDAFEKSRDRYACFWFARDVEMQRALLHDYERVAPALRCVAFTTEFEWEKNVAGEWYTTELVDPEVREEVVSSGDESGDDEGDEDEAEDGDME